MISEYEKRRRHALQIALHAAGYQAVTPPLDDPNFNSKAWLPVVKGLVEAKIKEFRKVIETAEREISKINRAEKEAEKRWVCPVEGCDCPHCRKCGHHYDGVGEICPSCQVDRARSEMEAITKAFGGNSEAAAKYLEGIHQ